MTQRAGSHDTHASWLEDIEYRREFGSESAKLAMAAALVRARELANMTQSALAELAGTSQAYIAKLESGDANPTIGNIGRLLACMWLRAAIEPARMEPFTYMEPVPAQDMRAAEARGDYFGDSAPSAA